MSKKQAKPEEPAGESAPMWIVSFADLVTLMMSFFVVLYALKQGGPQQQLETAAAIKNQFGYLPPDDSTDPLDLAVAQLQGRRLPPMNNHLGRATVEARGADGHNDFVSSIRPGHQIGAGGKIVFEPNATTLSEEARQTIAQIAERLKGHNNVLMLKGHVSPDELSLRPDDPDGMTLSIRRATVVADALIKLGIDRRLLRPVACGSYEPLKTQAYDPAAQRENRRVEIFDTDTVLSEYVPATLVPATTRSAAPQ